MSKQESSIIIENFFHLLERLIAKNTRIKIIIKDNKCYCPSCNKLIGKYPYCKYCGQALDVN